MPQGLGGKSSVDGREASLPGTGRRVLRDGEASTSRDRVIVFEHDDKDEHDCMETGREVTQTAGRRRYSSSGVHHVLVLV